MLPARPFRRRTISSRSFDDEGARKGYCLYKMGCKGPTTYNACSTVRWNDGVSFPIQAGHGCIGCSEDGFWDKGSWYARLSDIAEKALASKPTPIRSASPPPEWWAAPSPIHAAVSALKRAQHKGDVK